MLTAQELFASPFQTDLDEAFRKARQAAAQWRHSGNHFSAGMASSVALQAAWGRLAPMSAAANAAIEDFSKAMSSSARGTACWIASGLELLYLLSQFALPLDPQRPAADAEIKQLREELAQTVFATYGDDPHAEHYLVRGILITTDLNGAWTVDFPPYDVDGGRSSYGATVTLEVPSSFRLFVANSDWEGAYQIIRKVPNAFNSAIQKAWRSVVLASIEPEHAVLHFEDAANSFADDSAPSAKEMLQSGQSWSSINQMLWAPYYRSRARVVGAIQKPTDTKDLLMRAIECLPDTAWRSPEVTRFAILIKSLAAALSGQLTFDLDHALEDYNRQVRPWGEREEDRCALTFIKKVAEALEGFALKPATEMTGNRIASALEALSRVPVIGSELSSVARPALGEVALRAAFGPIRSWMHRAIEGITDEAVFRRVLLRLLQGGLPLYAQLRHGPMEYGKDLVALIQDGNEVVLRMYQAKCGELDKRKWRESKDELEEMFLVPIASLHLPEDPSRTEGILITNGHANPFVEPNMNAWFREQADRGHTIEFMHIDRLVNWISNSRLISELRLALRENNVDVP